MVNTNQPSWLPKRSIGPVYITIAMGVMMVLYWGYQAFFGGEERAARAANEQLSERVHQVCAQSTPGVRQAMGGAIGRPNGPVECIWGPNPDNEIYLRHGMSTLDRHLDAAKYDSTATSAEGATLHISDSPPDCRAAFDDQLGHYFELNVTKTDDPTCTRIGTIAGELADRIVE